MPGKNKKKIDRLSGIINDLDVGLNNKSININLNINNGNIINSKTKQNDNFLSNNNNTIDNAITNINNNSLNGNSLNGNSLNSNSLNGNSLNSNSLNGNSLNGNSLNSNSSILTLPKKREINQSDLKVAEFYMAKLKEFKKDYNEKTTILMQVGSFFEIYGFKYPDGRTEGDIWNISDDLELKIALKKGMTVYDDPSIEVYMSGVKEEYVDPYLEKAIDKYGWSVAVFVQEKVPGSSNKHIRVLKKIVTPGTNIETDNISNVIMYIYMKGTTSKFTGKTSLNIGIYFIDCISGENGILELHTSNINDYSIIFNEILKIITIKNPAELILHLDITNIENYKQFNNEELYTSLILYDKNVHIKKESINNNFKNKEIQKQLFEHCFIKYKSKEDIFQVLNLDGQVDFSRITISLMLDYIIKHDESVIKNLEKPSVLKSSSYYLMLANNCLQQLDIIDTSKSKVSQLSKESDNFDSNKLNNLNTKRITLLDLLDKTRSIIGSRLFRQRLSIPITDVDILRERYDNIEDWVKIQNNYMSSNNSDYVLSPQNEMRNILYSIKDIQKLMRKMAMVKLQSNDIESFLETCQAIINLRKYINSDKIKKLGTFNKEQIKEPFDNINTFIKLTNKVEKTFNLDVCNNHWNNIEDNIFNEGFNKDLDDLQSKINIDKSFMDVLIIELTKKIEPKTKKFDILKNENKNNTTNKNETIDKNNLIMNAKSEYYSKDDMLVKKGENVKLGKYIYVNNKHKEILSKKKFNITCGEYVITEKDIEFKSIKSGQWQIKSNILYLSVKNLMSNIEKIKYLMKKKFEEWQEKFFLQNNNVITEYVEFVGEIDIIQSCVYVINKYGYCKPTIGNIYNENENDGTDKKDNKKTSYLDAKEIRHPIIEKILDNTPYVANDVVFGKPGNRGILLFGVNAAGKSSCMKSIGINIIMAQAGMWVPCTSFDFYPYKYLFTRIRNNDDIYAGLSSFEVEMKEFNVILKYSDENSIILGDELCSGTETLDATAIVASGLYKLHERKTSFIFATHLHFLAQHKMVTGLQDLNFYHLSVEKDKTDPSRLIYERKLKPGNGPSSYGILVCKSMNMDNDFIDMAIKIRRDIEEGKVFKLDGRLNGNDEIDVNSFKISKYNSKKVLDKCQICKGPAVDTHHINEQSDADMNGIIGGKFHKNEKWNLVSLCKICHQSIHADPPGIIIRGYKDTSKGPILDFEIINDKNTNNNIVPNNIVDNNIVDNNIVNNNIVNNNIMNNNNFNNNIVNNNNFNDNKNNLSNEIREYIHNLALNGKSAKSIQTNLRNHKSFKMTIKDIQQFLD